MKAAVGRDCRSRGRFRQARGSGGSRRAVDQTARAHCASWHGVGVPCTAGSVSGRRPSGTAPERLAGFWSTRVDFRSTQTIGAEAAVAPPSGGRNTPRPFGERLPSRVSYPAQLHVRTKNSTRSILYRGQELTLKPVLLSRGPVGVTAIDGSRHAAPESLSPACMLK